MKVRMKVSISGAHDGQPWPPAGEVIDLPEAEAVKLLANGQAVAAKAKEEVETRPAPVAEVEKTTVEPEKRGPGRPRKNP